MTVTEQTFGFAAHQPNAGYVRTLWLLREPDVVALLAPSAQPMTVGRTDLLVRTGAVVTRLQPPARTATFEEPSQADRAGTLYQPQLTLTLPLPPADFDDFLTRHQAVRWVVFWLDYHGQGWVAGQPTNGLQLRVQRRQTEHHALDLQLSGRSWHPAWRLETTELAALFPNADFDFSFDLSFNS